ncbi:oxysterol-binding protein-related protein 6 [Biomphalaria pfeifferi]|uniref:Oxysterol-binding protein-related protein 6 n=1 Tax=Biomphalaria pfeifferi TaxID=112525 RepID=A0AAD8B0L2_BIOPF|nr:oxysterol-binding protein-related protein 6 [Biomphalaria pfeifferi]
MIKQVGISTSMNNSDETFGAILNKTEEQMATMSRGKNNSILKGDAVDGSAVYGCDSKPCKIGSHDKKPDICCDNA